MNVVLVDPDDRYRADLRDMAEEYRAAGEGQRYDGALENPTGYIGRLRWMARGEDLPAHLVQENTYWAYDGERMLGQTRLRHVLNNHLRIEGGHIGYDVRPSERRKGYGTEMLRLTLDKARALGLDRVMVTCDADNIASAKIIESNGGKLTGTVISPRSAKEILQYWIDV